MLDASTVRNFVADERERCDPRRVTLLRAVADAAAYLAATAAAKRRARMAADSAATRSETEQWERVDGAAGGR